MGRPQGPQQAPRAVFRPALPQSRQVVLQSAAMQAFDFSAVRRALALSGLHGRLSPDGRLSLVPDAEGRRRDDLRTVWGIDEHGNLTCDLTQVHGHQAGSDLLAALATNIPCAPGQETHVAGKIAQLMHSKVASLVQGHSAPEAGIERAA